MSFFFFSSACPVGAKSDLKKGGVSWALQKTVVVAAASLVNPMNPRGSRPPTSLPSYLRRLAWTWHDPARWAWEMAEIATCGSWIHAILRWKHSLFRRICFLNCCHPRHIGTLPASHSTQNWAIWHSTAASLVAGLKACSPHLAICWNFSSKKVLQYYSKWKIRTSRDTPSGHGSTQSDHKSSRVTLFLILQPSWKPSSSLARLLSKPIRRVSDKIWHNIELFCSNSHIVVLPVHFSRLYQRSGPRRQQSSRNRSRQDSGRSTFVQSSWLPGLVFFFP